MAFSANDIKNLALMEINHETITDWADTSNTDISIINAQYPLAKSVALTMYQWSWASKYAKLDTYTHVYTIPEDWVSGTTISLSTVNSEPITAYSHNDGSRTIFVNEDSLYLDYTATGGVATHVLLVGMPVSDIIGKYKRAVFMPEDFVAYLACYTNDQMSILADYCSVADVIYTNSDTLYVKYTSDVEESVFPPEFVDWFKIFLAQRLNSYLNADMQREQLLLQQEPFFFRKAKNIDSKRNKHDSLSGNPLLWIRGRLGGGI